VEPPPSPRTEYTRRLEARQSEANRQLGRYWTFARLRNWIVGVVILLAVLGDKERTVVKVGLLALPALLFEVAMRKRNRAGQAWRRAARSVGFYEQRLACIEDRWIGRGRSGLRFAEEAHPCALDLDLFGVGGLFELLCTAQTSLGEDTLAAWLRSPGTVEEVRARQTAVAELRSRLDLREVLVWLAGEVPTGGDLAALASWGQAGSSLPRPTTGILLAACLVALAGVTGTCFFGAGGFGLLAALLVQGGVSFWLRRRVAQVLEPVEMLAPVLAPLSRLMQLLEKERFTSPRLQLLQTALEAHGSPASRRTLLLGRLLARGPLAFLFLARPLLALFVESWRRTSGHDLARWLTALGEFEALASLAAHSFENPDDPFPELIGEGSCFDAESLGHPLLPRARCVGNDVHLTGPLRLLVVSGSNMSGKSTLLRTVGVNVVLALAGGPVRAKRLSLSLLAIGATLRVQDSLQAGRSRFYAEVLRVRQLLDLAQKGPLLFLLDELFGGTNSQDRRVGAEAVVRTLLDRGALGLITTHDLTLTEIADHLAPRAANVHFRDDFENGSLTFDYRMRPGVVPCTNGLALMRAVGIEV
jgi:hypothetical protein